MFLNIIKHLLPSARAWRLNPDKFLRQFFDGLSVPLGDDIKTQLDNIYSDIDPQQTRELDAWDNQFAMPSTGLTEQERRDRLVGCWRQLGGQDPRYIEDTLRGVGFDVYVHEWWVPGTEAAIDVSAAATPRNPNTYLLDTGPPRYITECGEALAECGEASAVLGDRLDPRGYPLVNKDAVTYLIPASAATWPYFLYIGAATFPNLATIDSARKDEFETLCLKICPAQQWLGILVEYV